MFFKVTWGKSQQNVKAGKSSNSPENQQEHLINILMY